MPTYQLQIKQVVDYPRWDTYKTAREGKQSVSDNKRISH